MGRPAIYSPVVTSVTEMADDPGASGRLLFVLALFAGLLLRLVQLGSPDLFGPDEGAWAVGARNIVEGGLPQLLALSATPLGDAELAALMELVLEGLKGLLGHKRELRQARVAAYGQLLRDGLG